MLGAPVPGSRFTFADQPAPPVLTALNAAAMRFFDQAANVASTLPAPISEVVQGGLLLVRRTFFNQAPTAKPAQYVQNSTSILGTVGASDLDGDPITYTVVTAPAHGTVAISDQGAWTYTPPLFDNHGGSDSFTVRLTSPGPHVNLFGLTSTTVEVPVTIAPVLSLQAATSKFTVYNRTSKSLFFRQLEKGAVENLPAVGTEIAPGGSLDFEVERYFWSSNEARVAFGSAGNADWYAVSLYNLDGYRTGYASGCYASGENACDPTSKGGNTSANFYDPPNTIVDYTASDKQLQAKWLNQLCINGGPASCDFTVKTITPLLPDSKGKQLGSAAFNQSAAPAVKTFTYSFTETSTTSWEISGEASGTIDKLVTLKLAAKTGQQWQNSATVAETLTQNMLPYAYGAVYASPYLSDAVGDFTLKMGNTTWNLTDVKFTYPTADQCTSKACQGAVIFRQEPLQAGVSIFDPASSTLDPTYVADGKPRQLKVTAFNGSNSQPAVFTDKVTYTSSNPAVATVSASGAVTPLAPGTTTITANYDWTIGGMSDKVAKGVLVTVTAAPPPL